jgi:hypothetical protein
MATSEADVVRASALTSCARSATTLSVEELSTVKYRDPMPSLRLAESVTPHDSV